VGMATQLALSDWCALLAYPNCRINPTISPDSGLSPSISALDIVFRRRYDLCQLC